MDKISKIKTDLRMREWSEMVRECSRSGLTIREWCGDNGINIKTYYYRLKRVRDCICDSKFDSSVDSNCSSNHHDIVPIPVETVSDNVQPIKISTSNISIELPTSVTPQLLQTAIEVLKC